MNCFGRGCLWFFGLFMMFAGAAGAWQMTGDWMNSRASRTWPSVPGEVMWSSSQARTRSRRTGARSFDFLIDYRYEVKGQEYSGTRLDWSSIQKSDREVSSLMQKYPPRRKIKVFYDARNPKRSCLVPDSFSGTSVWAFPLFSRIFCFGLSIVALPIVDRAMSFFKRSSASD